MESLTTEFTAFDLFGSRRTRCVMNGVQGVASSNPAAPTKENQWVSSHKELTLFDFCARLVGLAGCLPDSLMPFADQCFRTLHFRRATCCGKILTVACTAISRIFDG
jgi:hypothetical protein